VQIANLEALDDLATVVQQLRSGSLPRGSASATSAGGNPAASSTARSRPASPAVELRQTNDPSQKKSEKKIADTSDLPGSTENRCKLDANSAESVWKQALSHIQDMTADYGSFYHGVASSAPNNLVVSFKAGYTLQKESLERPDRKATVERALALVTGEPVHVQFEVIAGEEPVQAKSKPATSLRQLRRDIEKHPMVHTAIELFDAEIDRVDRPRKSES